jgi:hypothetical protein
MLAERGWLLGLEKGLFLRYTYINSFFANPEEGMVRQTLSMSICQHLIQPEECVIGMLPRGRATRTVGFRIDGRGLSLCLTLSVPGSRDLEIEFNQFQLAPASWNRRAVANNSVVYFEEGEPGGPTYVFLVYGKRVLGEAVVARDKLTDFFRYDRLLKHCA